MTAVMPVDLPLVGRHVRLDLAEESDAQALFAALDFDEVWAAGYNGGPSARPREAGGWRQRIADAAKEQRVMYVVRDVATVRSPGAETGTEESTEQLLEATHVSVTTAA